MNAQIAFTNVAFDNTYKNAVHFKDKQERAIYFKEYAIEKHNINFDFGDALNTSIVFNNGDVKNLEFLNYNYCILFYNNETRYYFITNHDYTAGNQARYDLELDVLTTYMLDLDFSPCLIKRAHLSRFKDIDNNYCYFNLDDNSPFYEADNNEFKPLLLRKATTLDLKPFDDPMCNLWYAVNVIAWVYVFIDDDYEYKSYPCDDFTSNILLSAKEKQYSMRTTISNYGGNYKHNYSVLCYPLLRDNNSKMYMIQLNKNDKLIFNNKAIEDFFKNDPTAIANVYNVKISIKPPFYNMPARFNPDDKSVEIYFNNGDFNKPIEKLDNFYITRTGLSSNNIANGLIVGVDDKYIDLEYDTTNILNIPTKFNKATLINGSISPNNFYKYNPKLISSKYMALRLVDSIGNYFDYDIQKILSLDRTIPENQSLKFLYTEVIQPETTHAYLRYKAPLDDKSLYTQSTNTSYLGLVSNIDNSVDLQKEVYATFLANNKNFMTQKMLEIGRSALEKDITSGNKGGFAKRLGGEALSVGLNLTQLHYEIDNMKNAPDSITNASGSVIFNNNARQSLNPRVEYHSCLINDLLNANYQNMLYGYEYNRIDSISKYIDNRKYYNYVEAEIENVYLTSGFLINAVRDKIKDIFSKGIRFWNVTENMFKYDKFNYEKELEQ